MQRQYGLEPIFHPEQYHTLCRPGLPAPWRNRVCRPSCQFHVLYISVGSRGFLSAAEAHGLRRGTNTAALPSAGLPDQSQARKVFLDHGGPVKILMQQFWPGTSTPARLRNPWLESTLPIFTPNSRQGANTMF